MGYAPSSTCAKVVLVPIRVGAAAVTRVGVGYEALAQAIAVGGTCEACASKSITTRAAKNDALISHALYSSSSLFLLQSSLDCARLLALAALSSSYSLSSSARLRSNHWALDVSSSLSIIS